MKMDLLENYKEIIEETHTHNKNIDKEINELMDKIRSHINNLDPILHKKKNDLMIVKRNMEF